VAACQLSFSIFRLSHMDVVSGPDPQYTSSFLTEGVIVIVTFVFISVLLLFTVPIFITVLLPFLISLDIHYILLQTSAVGAKKKNKNYKKSHCGTI